jgi:hypothetical protein
MSKQTNYALLREAYAIIDGVPDEALCLNSWSANLGRVNPHRCGTLGCAAGILAVHPSMTAAGLQADGFGTPVFCGHEEYGALALFFKTTVDESRALFAWRNGSYLEDDGVLDRFKTDKQLWLYRVRAFLRAKGEHVAIEEPTT